MEKVNVKVCESVKCENRQFCKRYQTSKKEEKNENDNRSTNTT